MPVIGVNYWQKLEEDLSLSSFSFAWLLGIWLADAALSHYLHLGHVKVHILRCLTFAVSTVCMVSSGALSELLNGTIDQCNGQTPLACNGIQLSCIIYGSYLLWEMIITSCQPSKTALPMHIHHFMTELWVIATLSLHYIPRTPVLAFILLIFNQVTALSQLIRSQSPYLDMEIHCMNYASLAASAMVLSINLLGNAVFVLDALFALRWTEVIYVCISLPPILNGQFYTINALRQRIKEWENMHGSVSTAQTLCVLCTIMIEVKECRCFTE